LALFLLKNQAKQSQTNSGFLAGQISKSSYVTHQLLVISIYTIIFRFFPILFDFILGFSEINWLSRQPH